MSHEHLQAKLVQMPFDEWLELLAKTTSEETRYTIEECRQMIKKEEARAWYKEGFAPYTVFRETWDNENDCS